MPRLLMPITPSLAPLPLFVEERLDLCVDYGQEGGPSLRTTVIETRSGRDFRNIDWTTHKSAWEIGSRTVARDELESLRAFFLRRRAQAIGFRFRDWLEYELVRQVAEQLDATEYQIVKHYGPRDAHAYSVPIFKPDPATVRVYDGALEVTGGVSVDDVSGVIRFDTPPGGIVTVSCKYDKPVRFGVDAIGTSFEAWEQRKVDGEVVDVAIYNLASVPVIELRDDEVRELIA